MKRMPSSLARLFSILLQRVQAGPVYVYSTPAAHRSIWRWSRKKVPVRGVLRGVTDVVSDGVYSVLVRPEHQASASPYHRDFWALTPPRRRKR